MWECKNSCDGCCSNVMTELAVSRVEEEKAETIVCGGYWLLFLLGIVN